MRVATVLTSRPQAVCCSRCLSTRTRPCTSTAWHTLHVRQQAVFRRGLAASAGQTTTGEDGNDPAQKQLREAAALDKLIDAMLDAKNQQEVGALGSFPLLTAHATPCVQLTQVVAQNLLQCNQRFWLRLATRSDSAADQENKDRIAALSRTVRLSTCAMGVLHVPCVLQVMLLVDALVKEAEGQMSTSGEVLTEVLTAAAEEDGQWELPLRADKLQAMRSVMTAQAARLDEAFLGSAFAWMRKAKDDKLDGVCAGP